MVLKMLYNWDDMHIFAFAFPEKPHAGSSSSVFWVKQKVMSNKTLLHEQRLSAFIHFPLDSHSPTMPWGTKQAVRAPLKDHFLSQHGSRSFYANSTHGPIFTTPPPSPAHTGCRIDLYIKKEMGKREELGNRTREVTETDPKQHG